MLATTIAIYANPQYGFGFGYPQQYLVMPQNFGYGYLGQGQAGGGQESYFRAGALQASFDNAAQNPENHIFLKTITINLATTNTIHLYCYFFYPLHQFP